MKDLKVELKWAIIFVVMGLVWMVLERMAGLHDQHIDKHPIFTNLIAIPAIIIYVLALLEKRNTVHGGVMTYKEGFMTGLKLTLIIAVLSPVGQYITSTFITPQFFPNMIRYTVDNGILAQEQANMTFNLRTYLIQGVVAALVMGLVTSAIVAVFTRGKPKAT